MSRVQVPSPAFAHRSPSQRLRASDSGDVHPHPAVADESFSRLCEYAGRVGLRVQPRAIGSKNLFVIARCGDGGSQECIFVEQTPLHDREMRFGLVDLAAVREHKS